MTARAFVVTDTAPAVLRASTRARGCVCFTWDDGFSDQDTIRQMADARGQHHTFFITSNYIDTAGKLTTAQILAAYNNGHEIGTHGKAHSDMTSLTAAQRAVQYDDSLTAIEAIVGSGNCTSWAYPYGYLGRNTTTDSELYLRYQRIRSTSLGIGSGAQPYLYPLDDRAAFMMGAYPWTDTTHDAFLELVRYAARFPVAVVVYAHNPDSASNPTTVQVTEAMDLCQSLGVPCPTLKEAFPGEPLLLDPGFEDLAMNDVWIDQSSGGTAAIATDSPDTGLNGTKSLHLSCSGGADYALVSQPVSVLPGRTYTLSGRYRVSGTPASGVTARIRPITYAGSSAGSATSTSALTSTSWAAFSVDYTAASNVNWVVVDCLVNAVAAEAYFDHIHLGLKSGGTFG